jgi:hypothetical protein
VGEGKTPLTPLTPHPSTPTPPTPMWTTQIQEGAGGERGKGVGEGKSPSRTLPPSPLNTTPPLHLCEPPKFRLRCTVASSHVSWHVH